VVVARVPETPIYSATGEVTERLSSERIVADLRHRGRRAESFASPDVIAEELAEQCRPGDVVLVMSNGDFGGLVLKLLGRLRERHGG
jgi:UDP-N-acetylmuramate: L-alanyl-gamma-D-glutamyl-meso-diaminopimelate ligase